jgi:hypothetical protein
MNQAIGDLKHRVEERDRYGTLLVDCAVCSTYGWTKGAGSRWLLFCLALPFLILLPRSSLASDGEIEAYDNAGLGYLAAPSLSPGHILRPNTMFLLPRSNPQGTWEADLDSHWANLFLYKPHSYLIDGEWLYTDLKLSYALEDGLSVGVAVPMIGRGGGFSDSLIEGFHDALHLSKGHRTEFPRNQSIVQVVQGGKTNTLVKGDAWNIGDVGGFVVWEATPGDRHLPSVTFQMQGTVPTGDAGELEGLSEPSGSLGVVLSKRLWDSPLLAIGGVGLFYCPADDILGIKATREEHSGLLGVEYQYSRSLSLIAQNLSTSPVAADFFQFSHPTHELSVGFKWRFSKSGIVECAFVENIITYDNSADFGLHFAVCEKF